MDKAMYFMQIATLVSLALISLVGYLYIDHQRFKMKLDINKGTDYARAADYAAESVKTRLSDLNSKINFHMEKETNFRMDVYDLFEKLGKQVILLSEANAVALNTQTNYICQQIDNFSNDNSRLHMASIQAHNTNGEQLNRNIDALKETASILDSIVVSDSNERNTSRIRYHTLLNRINSREGVVAETKVGILRNVISSLYEAEEAAIDRADKEEEVKAVETANEKVGRDLSDVANDIAINWPKVEKVTVDDVTTAYTTDGVKLNGTGAPLGYDREYSHV